MPLMITTGIPRRIIDGERDEDNRRRQYDGGDTVLRRQAFWLQRRIEDLSVKECQELLLL